MVSLVYYPVFSLSGLTEWSHVTPIALHHGVLRTPVRANKASKFDTETSFGLPDCVLKRAIFCFVSVLELESGTNLLRFSNAA